MNADQLSFIQSWMEWQGEMNLPRNYNNVAVVLKENDVEQGREALTWEAYLSMARIGTAWYYESNNESLQRRKVVLEKEGWFINFGGNFWVAKNGSFVYADCELKDTLEVCEGTEQWKIDN